ncbi:MAG: winged helix-turn-helix domain-containing protein [Oscillospiraceae bacterium]|nr:response regulator transcription factor [Oscillospiraceae bacterium]
MILCVEDDDGIRELMIYTLSASGFEAKGFSDGAALMDELKINKPELIMLDIMLPGEDGLSILKKIRTNATTSDIPVIMATARGTEYDKVIGLDQGADDYLSKPFGMMEMISRVKAVLRRTQPNKKISVLKYGGIVLNNSEHTAEAEGQRINLTLKEYELLKIFMENPGLVFTRDQLLYSVWGAEFAGETRTVDVHIGTLRTKLGKCGSCIETVRGVGYRFEAV